MGTRVTTGLKVRLELKEGQGREKRRGGADRKNKTRPHNAKGVRRGDRVTVCAAVVGANPPWEGNPEDKGPLDHFDGRKVAYIGEHPRDLASPSERKGGIRKGRG